MKLLGKYADEEIAARSGRTVKAVEAKRESLEIPNAFATFHEWTEEEIRLLRSMNGTTPTPYTRQLSTYNPGSQAGRAGRGRFPGGQEASVAKGYPFWKTAAATLECGG